MKTVDEHHEWSDELYRQASAMLKRYARMGATTAPVSISETIARLDHVIANVRRYQ